MDVPVPLVVSGLGNPRHSPHVRRKCVRLKLRRREEEDRKRKKTLLGRSGGTPSINQTQIEQKSEFFVLCRETEGVSMVRISS